MSTPFRSVPWLEMQQSPAARLSNVLVQLGRTLSRSKSLAASQTQQDPRGGSDDR